VSTLIKQSSFFKGQRNVITIFGGLSPFQVEGGALMKEFENADDVRRLEIRSSANNLQLKCILFVQFLIQRRLLLPLLKQFIQCESYIRECYEHGSVMLEHKCSAALIGLAIIPLDQCFQFEFGFAQKKQQESNVQVAEVLTRIDKLVHEFIKNIAEQHGVEALSIEAKSPWIGQWVRRSLAPHLYYISTMGIKKSRNAVLGLLGADQSSYHFWDYITQCAKQRDRKVGMYLLSDIVATIVAVVNGYNNRVDRKRNKIQLLDDYFISLVCYCLK
jgi:hypothetical protein